ncbi:MAG: peroxiredoxin family protein [Oligoflexia bacterium]|nr:peroxiredoxin family protein [Oligoflexia bacterium]
MDSLFKYKWAIIGIVAMIVAGSGLFVGKLQEKKFLTNLHSSMGFTLMDVDYQMYSLKDLPKEKFLLLILTPDGIPTKTVLPFARFSAKSKSLTEIGIEIALVSKLSVDLLKNFQKATRFKGKVLLDPSGFIGRKIGAWTTQNETTNWNYVIIDKDMNIYWKTSAQQPLLIEQLVDSVRRFVK